MNHPTIPIQPLGLLALYMAAVLFLVGIIIGISHILGQRHRGRATGIPYESGHMPTGGAWIRFDVKFYLVAMFFVIFDVESIFIFAWAVVVKEAGWCGYVAILVFISVLLAALFYLWRMGALNWVTSKQNRIPHQTGGRGS